MHGDEKLETIKFGKDWETSNVIYMYGMFNGCGNLDLDCSEWNVSNVTEYYGFNQDAPGIILPLAWQTAE